MILGSWSLVLGAWSLVLTPTLCAVARRQRRLPAPEHFRNALVQSNQIGDLSRREVVTSLGGVVAGLQFPIGSERVAQKLQRLLVATSKKSLADVEHHRKRGAIHLARQLAIVLKRRPFQQGSDLIALLLRCLPDAQILESIYTHAAVSMGMLDAEDQGPRTKDHPSRPLTDRDSRRSLTEAEVASTAASPAECPVLGIPVVPGSVAARRPTAHARGSRHWAGRRAPAEPRSPVDSGSRRAVPDSMAARRPTAHARGSRHWAGRRAPAVPRSPVDLGSHLAVPDSKAARRPTAHAGGSHHSVGRRAPAEPRSPVDLGSRLAVPDSMAARRPTAHAGGSHHSVGRRAPAAPRSPVDLGSRLAVPDSMAARRPTAHAGGSHHSVGRRAPAEPRSPLDSSSRLAVPGSMAARWPTANAHGSHHSAGPGAPVERCCSARSPRCWLAAPTDARQAAGFPVGSRLSTLPCLETLA